MKATTYDVTYTLIYPDGKTHVFSYTHCATPFAKEKSGVKELFEIASHGSARLLRDYTMFEVHTGEEYCNGMFF